MKSNIHIYIFLNLGRLHDCADPCVVYWVLLKLYISKWSNSKAILKLTSIPTTFMKKLKSNYERKVVEMLIFLRLEEMHDYADTCVVFRS